MGGFVGISEWSSRGVGYIKGDKVYITWIRNDGEVMGEIRDLRTEDIGLIAHEV
jgi:hypothetical protein